MATQPINIIFQSPNAPKWNRVVAAFLSLIIPGVGQLYKGHFIAAILWFIVVVLGYAMFIFPGIIFHCLCVLGAFLGDTTK